MKINVGTALSAALERSGGSQRWLGMALHKSKSSVNNYLHGAPVQAGDAVDMAQTLSDSEFSMELGNMMLGLIKAFTGSKIPKELSALEVYDTSEEDEEKQAYQAKHISMIMANPEKLTSTERQALNDYLLEKLDSTVMDLTLLTVGAQKLDMTLMELFKERSDYYVKQRYMRKEPSRWQG